MRYFAIANFVHWARMNCVPSLKERFFNDIIKVLPGKVFHQKLCWLCPHSSRLMLSLGKFFEEYFGSSVFYMTRHHNTPFLLFRHLNKILNATTKPLALTFVVAPGAIWIVVRVSTGVRCFRSIFSTSYFASYSVRHIQVLRISSHSFPLHTLFPACGHRDITFRSLNPR